MPPRNPGRTLQSEDNLARRISYERQRRGWTYEGLARRMTDAGCAMNQTSAYKTEKGNPRRRILVEELVAFSAVFGIPVTELLLPPEVSASQEINRLYREASEAGYEAYAAQNRRADALDAIRELLAGAPDPAAVAATLLHVDREADEVRQYLDANQPRPFSRAAPLTREDYLAPEDEGI